MLGKSIIDWQVVKGKLDKAISRSGWPYYLCHTLSWLGAEWVKLGGFHQQRSLVNYVPCSWRCVRYICMANTSSVHFFPTCLFSRHTCMCAKSLQLYLTLCDHLDCNTPGSSVHGIFQARILEWVAMPSSRGSSWLGIEPASPASPSLAFFTAEPPGIQWALSKRQPPLAVKGTLVF